MHSNVSVKSDIEMLAVGLWAELCVDQNKNADCPKDFLTFLKKWANPGHFFIYFLLSFM